MMSEQEFYEWQGTLKIKYYAVAVAVFYAWWALWRFLLLPAIFGLMGIKG